MQITTMKPSATSFVRSEGPIKIHVYEPTTSLHESSAAVKTTYLYQTTAQTTGPQASPKPPRKPLNTHLTPMGSSTGTFVLAQSLKFDETSKANGQGSKTFDFKNESFPKSHWLRNSWIPRSIRNVLIEVKQHILEVFAGMVPPFGLVAWYQIRYMHYIQGVATAESFKFMELKLASHPAAKERKIYELQGLVEEAQRVSDRASNEAEAALAAKLIAIQTTKNETERLQAVIVQREEALRQEQQTSKQKLERAAKDHACLQSSARRKDLALEHERDNSRKAVQQAKNDGIREARRLTDLAIEKHAEVAARRQADKATIENLKKQTETDAKSILELRKKANSIGPKDETIAQLNAQVFEGNNLRKAAEAKKSEQESSVAETIKRRNLAEERARQQEKRAAAAEARCKTAEEKASQAEANALEAAQLLKSRDEQLATLKADSNSSHGYLQRCLDTAQQVNAGLHTSLAEARSDALKAEAQAKETQEALRGRIDKLEKQLPQKPIRSDIVALSRVFSSKELSVIPQPVPLVRLPRSHTEQHDHWGSDYRPVPRWEPPAKGKTMTPPEERGLPANTPTGPKSGR